MPSPSANDRLTERQRTIATSVALVDIMIEERVEIVSETVTTMCCDFDELFA